MKMSTFFLIFIIGNRFLNLFYVNEFKYVSCTSFKLIVITFEKYHKNIYIFLFYFQEFLPVGRKQMILAIKM